MTRELAKNILAEHIKLMEQENEPSLKEDIDALKMAIQALKNHDTFMKYSYEQGKQDALSQEPCQTCRNEHTSFCGNCKEYDEFEPCGDAISREDVIAEMEELNAVSFYEANEHSKEAYYEIKNMIKTIPSVTQKSGKWISVYERLPEDGQSVLFCDIDSDIMVGYHVEGRPNTHFSQDGTWEDMKNVKAWMPLPKPYEPQESEEISERNMKMWEELFKAESEDKT